MKPLYCAEKRVNSIAAYLCTQDQPKEIRVFLHFYFVRLLCVNLGRTAPEVLDTVLSEYIH